MVPFLSRLKIKYLAIIALLSFALKIYFEAILDFETYFFLPGQLYLFLLGMIAYYINKERHYSAQSQKILLMLTIVAVVIFPLWASVYFRACMYILFFFSIDACFKLTQRNKNDRFIGNLSYPLYLVHMLVIQVVTNFFSFMDLDSSMSFTVLSILFSFIVSLGILFIVEIPFDKFRTRFKSVN